MSRNRFGLSGPSTTFLCLCVNNFYYMRLFGNQLLQPVCVIAYTLRAPHRTSIKAQLRQVAEFGHKISTVCWEERKNFILICVDMSCCVYECSLLNWPNTVKHTRTYHMYRHTRTPRQCPKLCHLWFWLCAYLDFSLVIRTSASVCN